jgi:DNA-binding NtrC family response regulator/tetratricopeptide (TPR) repeat protein
VQAAWHHFEAGEVSRGLEAALAWEARSDREPGAPPSQAVEALGHAARAAGEGTAAGRRLLEAAGDVLEAMGQFEECAALRLRVAPGGDGSAAPAADDVRRLRKLGAVAHRAGDLDLALRSLLRCLDAAATEAAPVESLRARADLALLLHYRGESEAAREQAETGLGAWRSRSPAERRATLQAAVNLHSVLGQIHLRRLAVGPASQVLEAGLACARRLPSAANRTLLLNSLGLAYHLGGRLDRALATFREAERLGGEQGDPAALVSVRTNIAQILARRGRLAEAQALLDELTESAAVRQSVRLRLNVTYTRALFLHLLGAATAAEWREVARQSSEAGDAFLERFSHLYQAEACLVAGDLRQAGSLLGELDEPLLARQRLARQALHAALSGQGEEARRLRTATLEGEESPAMLHIWSLVHCGASALEQGALDESHGLLDKARRLARETDFVLARLECDLLLADLHLRRAGAGAGAKQEARFLRAAREAIEAARQPIPSPLAGLSPRARDARLPLLEARLLLLSPAAEQGRRPARAPRLDDLLAAAAGDAALAARPDERLLLECLTATAARQAGEAERARAALQRLAALEAAIAEQRAAGSPPVDPWQRFGLARHRPPAGSPELESRHVAALTRLLRIAAQGASFEAALAELGAALGAARIELLANGRTQVWGERASRRETTGDEGRLAAPLSWRGESLGTFVALGLKRPSAADDACLTAAALALAPRLWVEAQPSAHPGAAGHETQRLVLEERTPGRGTVPLEAARSRPRQRATTEALTRFFRDEGMVIAGPRLLAAARSALALAGADLPVLMTGESGTGKSLLGRILHRLGPRADGPYIAQSASAVPLELFEADLFGYERGAFTGAETARTGFLFQAAGGTFHLEEVGDLSPELQQRLLRVIEEREVRPLGSTRPRALDVRFIASTQRDLEALVAAGQFRKDLYYRLGAAPIHLPPLRECPEAIPEIVARHWRELTGESVRPSRGVVDALAAHPWPGNVRELVTVLRRLCIEGDRELSVRALRQILGDAPGRSLFAPDIFEGRTLAAVQKALEERHLEHLFRKHRGDLAAIALELGTSTRSVYRRFERLGLKPGRMRAERE